jgi:hypothetical protein
MQREDKRNEKREESNERTGKQRQKKGDAMTTVEMKTTD